MKPKLIALFAALFIMTGLGIISPLIGGKFSTPEPLPVLGEIKPFVFTSSLGREFSEKDLAGKVWVGNLFFTNCMGPCPTMSAHLALLASDFKRDPRINFASFSVDPERDTPEAMSEYAKRFKANTSLWHFLTGDEEKIKTLAVESFKLGVPEENTRIHSTRFVLVDDSGKIRGYYQGSDRKEINKIFAHIKQLLNRPRG